MGKAERGTPKDIANRIKAKGLQKLRWYCQMCEKQCRDENGFKCHCTSESHQRQLLLFADNPNKYMSTFSQEFKEGFMSILKRRFGTKRINANNVYQEYIHDREHVHMNSTEWETLTDFVKWLGREGLCLVDETDKGWFVTWVDRDPETIMYQEKQAKREKHQKDEEERSQLFIESQVKAGESKPQKEEKFTPLERVGEETISLGINLAKNTKVNKPASLSSVFQSPSAKVSKKTTDKPMKKRSALEDIMGHEMRAKKLKEEQAKPKVHSTQPPWLANGIVVKVMTKTLGTKYYGQKGVVLSIVNDFAAIIKLNDSGTKLKLDEVQLETVVPSEGRDVLILRGKYIDEIATLKSVNIKKFSATLKLKSNGRYVDEPYENFSKLYVQ